MTDMLCLLSWESAKFIDHRCDMVITHISIDQNDHSYIIQF